MKNCNTAFLFKWAISFGNKGKLKCELTGLYSHTERCACKTALSRTTAMLPIKRQQIESWRSLPDEELQHRLSLQVGHQVCPAKNWCHSGTVFSGREPVLCLSKQENRLQTQNQHWNCFGGKEHVSTLMLAHRAAAMAVDSCFNKQSSKLRQLEVHRVRNSNVQVEQNKTQPLLFRLEGSQLRLSGLEIRLPPQTLHCGGFLCFHGDNITASDRIRSEVRTAYLVIDCVISVVGMVGNGLVIYVTGFRMKRTVHSIWFLNLALADFLFTVFLIFYIIALYQDYWPFGLFMCKLETFVIVLNMFASVFFLMAISLDRCLCTCAVVWARNNRTVCKAQLVSVVIWLIAMICSIPYATFRKLEEKNGKTSCVYTKDKTLWLFLLIFRFIMAFLIPFLVITASYVAISVRTRRLQSERKQRSRRIILSVILAFFLCWVPYQVYRFLEFSTPDNPQLKVIFEHGYLLTTSLAFLNSCLNPILYVFMCDEFQKKLKQSIFLVFESALAEDRDTSQKSDSAVPVQSSGTATSFNLTENRVDAIEERETLSIE
ncbi:chemerin-like receptor 1 [Scomber japonicus]|uniref:chemerin-like receptor 1 n=1 Tax=Scomber japonicus TaxID=13676 RepID=UPI0023052276|nr:chemerin-like receptor 1 [Scomber japonicus]